MSGVQTFAFCSTDFCEIRTSLIDLEIRENPTVPRDRPQLAAPETGSYIGPECKRSINAESRSRTDTISIARSGAAAGSPQVTITP
jgi:hypothetical protein